MPIQTTYLASPATAIEGMVADASRQTDIMSRAATVAIPAGRFCVRAADGTCKLPTVTGDVTGAGVGLGVSMYDAVAAPGGYVQYDMVPIVHKGRVYVVVEEAVTEGDPVFVRFAAGAGGSNLGAFRKSADTATASQVPNAVYRSSASASGLAVVELNSP